MEGVDFLTTTRCSSLFSHCVRYPTSLFGAGILSKLYVPFSGVDKPSQKTPTASEIPLPRFRGVTMKPLDEHSVHELLLVYIARGKHGNDVASSSSTPSHQLTSLAASDSISVLLPKHLASGDQQSAPGSQNPPVATHQCTIKNPGSLWKKGTTVAKRNGASDGMEPHFLSAADSVFVEVRAIACDKMTWRRMRSEDPHFDPQCSTKCFHILSIQLPSRSENRALLEQRQTWQAECTRSSVEAAVGAPA